MTLQTEEWKKEKKTPIPKRVDSPFIEEIERDTD